VLVQPQYLRCSPELCRPPGAGRQLIWVLSLYWG